MHFPAHRSAATVRWLALGIAAALLGPLSCNATDATADGDLTAMSLSDLAKVEVTSVSKTNEVLQRAAATIYVISHDDIVRSGVTSVPEALRLAPNLLVTQSSASAYVISARGLGGNPTAQNFSNKLLILIDGRSVYTPLYSGIYADTIDVMLEDIDRIEVISGVGATLWGANAMNGVINIITRPSYLTKGSYADLGGGNQQQFGDGRYGAGVGDDGAVRVYGFGFHRGAMELADASGAGDGWSKGQAGFRSDWGLAQDTLTVQGDFYRATENVLNSLDGVLLGGNLLGRYEHHDSLSDLQVQAYIDQSEQLGPGGSSGFTVHTYDVSLQDALMLGSRNRIVWGGGERLYTYGITNETELLFVPASRDLTLANAFLQDTIALTGTVNAVLGMKAEDDPFSGWTPLPDARLSWAINDRMTTWAAASRGIRSPTPFDTDVQEKVGTEVFLHGNPDFRPEEVRALEIGTRAQPTDSLSFSIAGFHDHYDDLRTVEPNSATSFVPLYWGNMMRGNTFGIDSWASWQVTDWWRLSPGVTWVRERLTFSPGASGLLGTVQAGDDPGSHASLSSSMNLPHHLTLDAMLRYVGALPSPALPHYTELDTRLGWRMNRTVEFSLRGANLLHARHYELPAAAGEEITRSVIAEARCNF
ncbi:MAG TPA: TonB-dependent receptor [Steroidobacteraceae bacterium]|jgi:iron complex outermembrane receptor protein|nr:TonB-dependent receptor [Steroidobacteraceae bacterium]